ncbi:MULTISPECIES: helix-turn-helix transcriptional regulator [Nitrospirillum]|uniref:Helix-turn-helix protein n=1 Tax=Nitrospirillum amazonense TaxID=28077 RepID=A0A560FJ33_9PROT|nr:helix-turn-helix domain-containing protein [Nitrospirillum amazonense]MEC4594207.1 helix-turn-helix domain-containing protein [Nitrospirillum amazonense]TWB21605.1 helix-turn-helix protein [Nitrospirillum amazonense]
MAYKKKPAPLPVMAAGPIPRLLTPEEAGQLMGVAPQTLAHWRARGSGPAYVLLSARCVRYDEAVLRTWLESRVQASTAENVR